MIKDLPSSERPRERCLKEGATTLSLRECLAVILGSGPPNLGALGVANKILNAAPSVTLDEENFFRVFETQADLLLEDIEGLGAAGKARILVCLEIAKRYWRYKSCSLTLHNSGPLLSRQIRQSLPSTFRLSNEEQIGIIPTFHNGKIGKFYLVQKGEEKSVILSAQKLLRTLLFCRAQGFWLFHNHPNNHLEVSDEDRDFTKQVRFLARQLGFEFLGHWIVGWTEEILVDL